MPDLDDPFGELKCVLITSYDPAFVRSPAAVTRAPATSRRNPATPRLVATPYNMEAPKGSTIELPCKAEGEPKPVVSWTKDRVPIVLTTRHRSVQRCFTIMTGNSVVLVMVNV